MSPKHFQAMFDCDTWEEKDISLTDSKMRITRTRTERTFTGEGVSGKGIVEYVFAYHEDKTVTYNGLMHFSGKFGDLEPGEVVFVVHSGVYANGSADGKWTVDERSAIGGLKGLKGTGEYSSKGKTTPCSFDLEW